MMMMICCGFVVQQAEQQIHNILTCRRTHQHIKRGKLWICCGFL